MAMGSENRSSHGQVLPRERRSLREWWPGFLIGLDWVIAGVAGRFFLTLCSNSYRMQRQQPSS
jgi:hypothetical protein